MTGKGIVLAALSLSLSAIAQGAGNRAAIPQLNRAVIAYGLDAAGCNLAPPGLCPPVCPGNPCPGQVNGSGFLVIYRTAGAGNPPTGGTFQTLCPWPGLTGPMPSGITAVDWDPYTQQVFFLTMTANGPGYGEVWVTNLTTSTVRTPIVPPAANPLCNTTAVRFFDLAVYRDTVNARTLVAIAMNQFFGLGNNGLVAVYDPLTGALVTPSPICVPNPTFLRIDAGYVQNLTVNNGSGTVPVPGFYAAVLDAFPAFNPNGYNLRLFSIPPTSNNWVPQWAPIWTCSPPAPDFLRPLSVSVNPQIPGSCGVSPLSDVVIGGVQECGGLSGVGHSYMQRDLGGVFGATAFFTLRHSAWSAAGGDRLATDVVITANVPTAPAPMYAIQYGSTWCNSPAATFWWLDRECSAGNAVSLPNLPLSNVQPVDVAAIQ